MRHQIITTARLRELIDERFSDWHLQFPKDISEMVPFIGRNYEQTPDRLFILGESYYLDPVGNAREFPEGPHDRKDFSTASITVALWGMYQTAKLLKKPNAELSRATGHFARYATRYLCDGQGELEKAVEVWEQGAFWELIQRPLEARKKRPTKDDWENGWTVIKRLLPHLPAKPALIVALGKEMYNSFCRFCGSNCCRGCNSPLLGSISDDKSQVYPILFLDHPATWGLKSERVRELAAWVRRYRKEKFDAPM